jgi:DNA-binding PadR family transcriptional regulator
MLMAERKTRNPPPAPPAAASFLPLNPLEFRILLVLAGGASHAYRIVKEIEEREAGLTVYPANLYRRIRDLLERGLIEESAAGPREEGGRRRTLLKASELGRRVAKAEARRLEALVLEAREGRLLERA